uniref:ABC transporter ATP-binding subunit n=1 Tax=Saccharomonospora piscinae TaxID=687388 RepID=W5VMR0_SACPI|nr:ABC transporter ATP-binding subunit [Saccharomonospora piscinae]
MALDQVDIEVAEGTVLGLLGHNGAGKTTLVNILATISPPSSGSAEVAGFDVRREPAEVRRRIGVTGQFAALDAQLAGLDNLMTVARLLGASKRQARRRAEELLQHFGLSEAAHRPARTYSGGMRRRLDLAISLIARPSVLFLDEPTTGLDPESRRALWATIQSLVSDGSTVLLTTQYLEEADHLADYITVLNSGRVVASGTVAGLKAEVGTRTIHMTFNDNPDARRAMAGFRTEKLTPVHDNDAGVTLPVNDAAELGAVMRVLAGTGVDVIGLSVTEPTLDDVYLALTGTTNHGR